MDYAVHLSPLQNKLRKIRDLTSPFSITFCDRHDIDPQHFSTRSQSIINPFLTAITTFSSFLQPICPIDESVNVKLCTRYSLTVLFWNTNGATQHKQQFDLLLQDRYCPDHGDTPHYTITLLHRKLYYIQNR